MVLGLGGGGIILSITALIFFFYFLSLYDNNKINNKIIITIIIRFLHNIKKVKFKEYSECPIYRITQSLKKNIPGIEKNHLVFFRFLIPKNEVQEQTITVNACGYKISGYPTYLKAGALFYSFTAFSPTLPT